MEIVLEAGAAFGSGDHPSTRLCLHLLEWLAASATVENTLDIGCGSGVLSIAAAKLLGTRVLASDLSREAVEQTLKNAELSELRARIAAVRSDGPYAAEIAGRAPYDLILCNVLAETISPWLHTLKALMAPGGFLVCSGILSWQAPVFQAHAEAAGFRLHRGIAGEGWIALLMRA